MKKIILMLTIVVLAATQSMSQDKNYGIPLFSYEVEQRLPGDTTLMRHNVEFNSMRFYNDKVIFYYHVQTLRDTILISDTKQLEVVLDKKELDAEIQGKQVRKWIDGLYSPQDSLVIKALSEIAYKYKVIGKN